PFGEDGKLCESRASALADMGGEGQDEHGQRQREEQPIPGCQARTHRDKVCERRTLLQFGVARGRRNTAWWISWASMRFLLCDDHALFREGLQLVLGQLDDPVELVGVGDAESALAIVRENDDLD